MATGYCKDCIYSEEKEGFVPPIRLETAPLNLNSISIKALAQEGQTPSKILCCNNTGNSPINFTDGSIALSPCEIWNKEGQCKYFDNGLST